MTGSTTMASSMVTFQNKQVSSKLAGRCQPGPRNSSIIINGVSTSQSRHIILCALNEQSPQLSSQLHMHGVCESRRGVLPSPAPAAYCGQVNRRRQLGASTAIHAHRSLLPSCSTHMKTSQPSACQLSWGLEEALSQECPHSSPILLLFLYSFYSDWCTSSLNGQKQI